MERQARGRWPWKAKAAAALGIGIAANALLVIREAQHGDPQRLAQLKAIERRWANPLILKMAGARPWGVSRLEHRGRRSGKTYFTPLWAMPVTDGFIIGMPYGDESDWVKNLLAGIGTLQHHGVRHRVGNARVVPVAAVERALPLRLRVVCALLGIRSVLRVNILPETVQESTSA